MREVPITAIRGVVTIFKPYRPALSVEALEKFLNGVTDAKKPVPVSALMALTGKAKTSVKDILRAAGVEPIGRGGKTGKENLYDREKALKAMEGF